MKTLHQYLLLGGAILVSLFSALSIQAQEDALSIARDGDQISLSWEASSDSSFVVQRSILGENGVWLNAQNTVPWPITDTSWADPQPMEGNAFYRLLQVTPAEQGKILQVETNTTYTKSFLQVVINFVAPKGYDLTAQYNVNELKVTYETITPLGEKTTATGLLCVPVGCSLPSVLLSYQHGTSIKKSDALSNPEISEEKYALAIAASIYGEVVSAADYLGLGDGPGLHPYCHAVSEATACIDMMRATRKYCSANGVALDGRVGLLGYSQGGHATMALHRELETYYTDEFSVMGSAPMAGPYDLSGTMLDDILSGREMDNPFYVVMLLAGYQEVYHLADSLGAIFVFPYDETLPPLLDGYHSGGEINEAMPASPLLVIKPELQEAIRSNPDHPIRIALRDNDTYDWTPKAPMHLYHCAGDKTILIANSEIAIESFAKRGVTVLFTDPDPTLDHEDGAVQCLLNGILWLESLKEE